MPLGRVLKRAARLTPIAPVAQVPAKPPIIGQRPVTFVLDSVVYWRFSLGMEAWIMTGAVLEAFRAVRIPNFVDHCATGIRCLRADCRVSRVPCLRAIRAPRGAPKTDITPE